MFHKSFFVTACMTALSCVVAAAGEESPTKNDLQGGTLKHKTAHELHAEDRAASMFFEDVPGEFTGILGFFGQNYNGSESGSSDDFASFYFAPHYGLDFKNGLSLETGAILTQDLVSHEGYDSIIANDAILSELSIAYSYSESKLKLGRQSLEFILLEDYFDGITFESREIDNLDLRFAWVVKGATLDPDDLTEFSKDYFATENDSDGLYVLEADYQITEGLTLSGSYAYANGLYQQYGGRSAWEHSFGAVANCLTVELFAVDNYDDEDGRMFHINDTVTIGDLSVGAGYIATSENGGVGGLLNNFYDPFAEDNIEDFTNLTAYYVTAGYDFNSSTNCSVTYGIKRADFDDGETSFYDDKIEELDLVLSHSLTELLTTEFAFINYNSEKGDSWTRFYANIVYNF